MVARKQKDDLNWGEEAKLQTRLLLENLLAAAEGQLPEKLDRPKPKWEGETNNLAVKTTMLELKRLMEHRGYYFSTIKNFQTPAEKETYIPQALRDTIERLKLLRILIAPDQSGQRTLNYRLEFLSRDRKENLEHFDKCWKEYKEAKSVKTQVGKSDRFIPTKKAIISEICPYKGLSAFTTEDAPFSMEYRS
ncbi:hypothetical protein BCD67_22150 [Oscillatoriales cyanobacterium USR001]|nr:hypothetical protein BCD67_22150 [Oscillatoriales cyanobacterium USR001]